MILGRMATVSFGLPEEGSMPTPTIDVESLHRRILATSAALHGARAAFEHSPNAQNQQAAETAERRLNDLLDRLPRETTA